ncbi:MAG: acetyl-CoA carboxylase biotin carboxyl carrier protein [Candidatus Margulisiibacteriota bacterium]|jgi:acetyl-CoA carboxylase biotin carboxyl carrier protein
MADWEIVKKLIQTVKDEDISGLSIEENGVKYEVRREKGQIASSHAPTPIHHAPAASHVTPAKLAPVAPTEEEGDDIVAITSPMVGTFYASPSPEAPAFVNVGDNVDTNKIVCIVEAMKLFNEIEAEVKGKIIKVLAQNGKPVEYGQKLFLVKKA